MSTKTSSINDRTGRSRTRQQTAAWPESGDERSTPEWAEARSDGDDALRQTAARRKLEQYLESKRLREHLQEIFYDDER